MMANNAFQRSLLTLSGVHIQILDEKQVPINGLTASGFIRRENSRHYLYTCWHVAAGFDPNNVRIPSVSAAFPVRRFFKISLQDATKPYENMEVVGGIQTYILPLYASPDFPLQPLWLQDNQHIQHADLNHAGLHVPFWHDVIKIQLPDEVRISEMQEIDESRLNSAMSLQVGDKCFIVGFPHGYSASGAEQPTAVALTRFIAATHIAKRRQQILIDGMASPGMSGGPVFVERGDNLLLAGIYTGSIFPDEQRTPHTSVTALGTISNLGLLLGNGMSLVAHPSEALDIDGNPAAT